MAVQFTDDPILENIIQLKDVNQTYDNGNTYIIKDFNLLVENKPERGEFVVLLGMSGCGKSTILRYIAGLQKPSGGEVLVNNEPISEDNRVSMVFQQYSSFPWMTVLENVGLGLKFKGVSKKERDEKAMEFIKLVGLDGHQKKYAQYPTLSGGQLQRVAIARSLISNPEILLMDEPFGALDVKTRLQMQDLLIEIWEHFRPTILFVTHDIQEAVYLGDDIYIMKHTPSNIVKHFKVDLPLERNRETKRMGRYDQLVHEVEDAMMNIDSGNYGS